jgi:hypothetical protein
MEEKIFEPSVDKLLYEIKISVYKNCAGMSLGNNSSYKPTFHEVIGALETQKQHLMYNQRESNLSKNLNVKNPYYDKNRKHAPKRKDNKGAKKASN